MFWTKTDNVSIATKGGSRILKWGVNFCNNVIEPKPGWGDKKKKKEGDSEKGGRGGGGVKIHPFHLPWIRAWATQCVQFLRKILLSYFPT